jgi:hypothetical protein
MAPPIYNNDPLFGSTLAKTSCPARRDISSNIGGGTGRGLVSTYVIPQCTNEHEFEFTSNPEESTYGCCVVDSSYNRCIDNIPEDRRMPGGDGGDYDISINLYDANGANPRKICHSAPIRKRTIKLEEFFKSIGISTGAIIGVSIIGACYEFWLKHGDSDVNASKCNRLTYRDSHVSIVDTPIDYSFPTDANVWPYRNSRGGSLIWPYTMLQFGKEDDTSSKWFILLKAIYKAFQLNWLLMILFSRRFISWVLKSLSTSYKRIENRYLLQNLVFLFLTGIIFYVIAKSTGNTKWNIGMGSIFYILLLCVVFAMVIVLVVTNCLLYWTSSGYNNFIGNETGIVMQAEHTLINKALYPRADANKWWLTKENFWRFVSNIGLFIWGLITILIAVCVGFIGAIFGLCYMVCSLFGNLFFVPIIWKYECLFTIIKDHSELLIILFCLSIILSSAQNLNSTTTIVIALLVGIIILYKMYIHSGNKNT